MQIRNLRLPDPSATTAAPTMPVDGEIIAVQMAMPAVEQVSDGSAELIGRGDHEASRLDRQALEIALLKARVQHLEVVVETARSLMGSNQERLLRRLHDAPREIAGLTAQLRRVDPEMTW